MSPFLVLLIGIVFIVVTVAVFKIHPFFALLLAAVLVGILSPRALRDTPPDTVHIWDTSTLGERLPGGAALMTLRGSAGRVSSLAYSTDGALLAAASSSGAISMWETGNGREVVWEEPDDGGIRRLGGDDPVHDLAFSPDGSYLASACESGILRLWSRETGEQVARFEGHTAAVRAVAFGAGGRLASGSDDGTVRLWDLETRKEKGRLNANGGSVRSLVFDPEGRNLASGSEDGVVRLWNASTREQVGRLEGHTRVVHSLAFHPGGRMLASASGDRTIRLWDAQSRSEYKALEGHQGPALTAAFNPDGSRLASGSTDKTVRVWDTSTAAELLKLEGYPGSVFSVAYRPPAGEQLAAGFQDTLDPEPRAVLALELTAEAFGSLAGRIGIVIALAAVIGQCLMESGAADKITRRLLAFLGERRSHVALLGSGYILSVPVFFDTVFFLLVPLARALRMRTGRNYVLYVMAICAGGAITHSIVPPTPGPLVMVEQLNLDLGMAIGVGFLLGLPVAIFGSMVVGGLMNRKFDIPLREVAGSSKEELEAIVKRREDELPGFLVSMAPVMLPVFMITAHSVVDALRKNAADPQAYVGLFSLTAVCGNKLFALGLGTAIAIWVLARQKGYSLRRLMDALEPALLAAGVIILITCAGGAFGDMLKRTGIGQAIHEATSGEEQAAGVLFILIAWGVASAMKIAQGSGTVAMITASSIMASLLVGGGVELPYHPIYIFAAIAFGSKVFSWMNDSGFWVVCKMSGFTQEETLKTWTVMLAAMGVVGLVEVLVLSSILPLK